MTVKNTALVPVSKLPTATLALVTRGEIVPVETDDRELSDGYLRLASHILLKSREQTVRTIGVISAVGEEGKTTAALNLAICLGRTQGRLGRVLLVDGDTEGRTLTRLVGGVEGETRQVAHHPRLRITGFRGVDLMTAPVHDDGLALHDPGAWHAMLEALSARYSMILVDCPSVLDSPHGLVLPSCVDSIVLVVRAGHTDRDAIARTLRGVKKPPLGVILNGGEASDGASARVTW